MSWVSSWVSIYSIFYSMKFSFTQSSTSTRPWLVFHEIIFISSSSRLLVLDNVCWSSNKYYIKCRYSIMTIRSSTRWIFLLLSPTRSLSTISLSSHTCGSSTSTGNSMMLIYQVLVLRWVPVLNDENTSSSIGTRLSTIQISLSRKSIRNMTRTQNLTWWSLNLTF